MWSVKNYDTGKRKEQFGGEKKPKKREKPCNYFNWEDKAEKNENEKNIRPDTKNSVMVITQSLKMYPSSPTRSPSLVLRIIHEYHT